MKYNGVAIEMTTVCPLHCSHCCQDNGEKAICLSKNEISQIISEISQDKKIEYVSFTGGEPFLDREKLYYAIDTARNNGFHTSTVTSGFWAVDDEITEKVIKTLHEKELDVITVSRDSFHRREVPDDNINKILKWGKVYDLEINIQISTIQNTDFGEILNPLQREILNTKVEIFPVFYAGRAKEKIAKEMLLYNEHPRHQFCGKGGACLIAANGDVYPCCSPLGKETFFKLGNIKRNSMADIREKLQRNAILHILRNFGFDPFIDLAEEKLGMCIPEKIISPCDLCADFFNEQNIFAFYANIDWVKERIEKGVYRYD